MYIKKLLNEQAKKLMKAAPQNLKHQTDAFVKEVAESVNEYIKEADKKVELAEAGSTKVTPGEGEQYFLKKKHAGSVGSFDTLFRVSAPDRALQCMNMKKAPEQCIFCSVACSGFEKLDNGGVRLCNGRIINIVEE